MHLFLEALASRPTPRPPVWLMRQAGRYLPGYQALRKKYTLSELFHDPELAAEITLMPVQELGVDAAILFSDILIIAELFGIEIEFPMSGGPRPRSAIDLAQLIERPPLPARSTLSYVKETITRLKAQLKVPLIGFCGGPYTVATYLFGKAPPLADPRFEVLLAHITEASIDHLDLQIDAGVDAIQVFDSWAGLLPPEAFQRLSCRHLERLVTHVKGRGIPILLFSRGSSRFARELAALEPSGISFDEEASLGELRRIVPAHIAVQGNLSPTLLRDAPAKEVTRATEHLLASMQGQRGFIANLGHGVLPGTPVANVQAFVQAVRDVETTS